MNQSINERERTCSMSYRFCVYVLYIRCFNKNEFHFNNHFEMMKLLVPEIFPLNK
jgi:hypothetical protein